MLVDSLAETLAEMEAETLGDTLGDVETEALVDILAGQNVYIVFTGIPNFHCKNPRWLIF